MHVEVCYRVHRRKDQVGHRKGATSQCGGLMTRDWSVDRLPLGDGPMDALVVAIKCGGTTPWVLIHPDQGSRLRSDVWARHSNRWTS